MSKNFISVFLRDILESVSRSEIVEPQKTYRILGAHWYAKGLYIKDIKDGSLIQAKTVYKVKENDFVYNRLFAWKGSFAIATENNDNCYVSNEFPCFIVNSEIVDRKYLWLYFSRKSAWNEALGLSSGGTPTSRNRLKENKFLSMKISLPPLEQQRRIVAKVEELAGKIEEARSLREQTNKLTKAFFTSASTKILSNNSTHGYLSDVLLEKPKNGWSPRRDNLPTGIPVLSLGAVTGFDYNGTEFKRTSEYVDENAHYWLEKGDFLITRSNSPELVGHAAIYDGNPSPCIYPDLMMRLQINESKADPRFVHFWLTCTPVRDYIKRNAKGTSPSMKKISQGIVMKIPFPEGITLSEQQHIVDYLDRLKNKVDEMKRLREQSLQEINALLPSILDKAFKGEL